MIKGVGSYNNDSGYTQREGFELAKLAFARFVPEFDSVVLEDNERNEDDTQDEIVISFSSGISAFMPVRKYADWIEENLSGYEGLGDFQIHAIDSE